MLIFLFYCLQCRDFVKAGAEEALTPSDVISAADITFSCVSEPQVAKDVSHDDATCNSMRSHGERQKGIRSSFSLHLAFFFRILPLVFPFYCRRLTSPLSYVNDHIDYCLIGIVADGVRQLWCSSGNDQ